MSPAIGEQAQIKNWADCGIEEKCERLRERVHSLEEIIGNIMRLCDHQHDSAGNVMVRLYNGPSYSAGIRSKLDPNVNFEIGDCHLKKS